MRVATGSQIEPAGVNNISLFACGLRPFFLFAGLDALFNMLIWLAAFLDPGLWPAGAIPAMYWHAHEMLFGFATAAIAGFLLTAVPGWTGRSSYSGAPLISLVALWFAGRLASMNVASLASYRTTAPHAERAVPSPEHFDPIFVVLGSARSGERATTVYEGFRYGTLSMRSFSIG